MRPLRMAVLGALLTAGISLAQVTGTVWQNTPDSNNAADPANMGSALPSATFTSSGIGYCSAPGSPAAGFTCPAGSAYNVGAFLNNPTFSNEMNGFNPTIAMDNTEVQLTGTIALAAGANNFQIGHDDGLTLQITGGPGTTTCSTQSGGLCVNVPGPTGFDSTPFSITPTVAGNYTFTLDYSECCGPPAYLLFAFPSGVPIGSTPEPASLALLSTVLAGVGLSLRRRKSA